MGRGTRYNHVEMILERYKKPDDFVLEIGCGGAVYKDLFRNYIGVDLPGNPYEELGDVDVYCSGEHIPFKKESFDLVFMVGCLYQIPYVEKVLHDCKRVLKKCGHLLIFDYNLKATRRLKELERGGDNQNHVWSPFSLASLVKKIGFETSIIYDFKETESPIRWKRLLWKFRIVKFTIFLCSQLREGWNIVIGEKLNNERGGGLPNKIISMFEREGRVTPFPSSSIYPLPN